jgi:hypothetical protein
VVASLGGVASAAPTTSARTVTPTAISNIARLMTFILSLFPYPLGAGLWVGSGLMAPPLALSPKSERPATRASVG